MKKIIILTSFFLLFLFLNKKENAFAPQTASLVAIDTPIKVLVLKHSKEKMADDDAKMVIDAVEKAKQNLDVKVIGNHFINETKKIRAAICEYNSIDNLKDFISQQIKESNLPKDSNLIIFTIGHGSTSGYLHNLGERAELQKAIAEAAEENNQKILWWQLSCYSAARLPSIETLPVLQKKLFSVLNTSDEKTPSPAYIEGKIMEKMFSSIISEEIDVNKDQEIDGYEFKNKMNEIKKGRGDLFRTHDMSAPLFGMNLANRIPVCDIEKNQIIPRGFIPLPSKYKK